MPRSVDPDFATDELLYRRLRAVDVDGGAVLLTGVDLLGTSVHRGKYTAGIDDVRACFTADQSCIASVRVGDLPADVEASNIKYEFFAEDLPEEGKNWHAEIRHRRKGESWKRGKPDGKTSKQALREALAASMRVIP